MDIQKEIDGYLHFCQSQKKLSASSLKAYTIDLHQFSHFCTTSSEQCMSRATITRFMQELHKKHLPRTVKRKTASLSAFFNFLEFEEILDSNPMRKINTKLNNTKQLPKILPLRLFEQLRSAAQGEHEIATTPVALVSALRDIAILEILFATGLRVSELCSLRKEDVSLDDGIVNIRGKGMKERIIQIENSDVIKSLHRYKDVNVNETSFFFTNRLGSRHSEQSVRFMIQRLSKKAGITMHLTPHMFRQSLATHLLEEDVDIRYIQRILGHSSIQTTQVYTREAMEKHRQVLVLKNQKSMS